MFFSFHIISSYSISFIISSLAHYVVSEDHVSLLQLVILKHPLLREFLSYKKTNSMASEDVHDVTVGSDGSNDAMRGKLLGLLSRLNEHLSPDVKSHFTNMMRQYKELDDSERKDFDENVKQQLTDRIANAARNHYITEMMSSVLVAVCGATVFLLFGMTPVFQFL